MVHPQVLFHRATKFSVVHLMLMELSLSLVALTLLQGYIKHIYSGLSCIYASSAYYFSCFTFFF